MMDIIYGPSIGFYTLQYFLAAVVMHYFASRMYTDNFYVASILAALGILAKELVAMAIVFFMGRPINAMLVLVRYTLPIVLTTAVLTLLTEVFMKWLYKFKFMTRKATTEFLDNL
jgi:cell shape-determining protein MreD